MDWNKLFGNLKLLNWIILLLLASTSSLLMNQTFTFGIISGGLIIIGNFNVLQHTIRQCFTPEGVLRANKASIIVKSYLRLAVLGILIFILITQGWVHPVGLAIGLSTVVIGIISIGIHMIWKTSSKEAV